MICNVLEDKYNFVLECWLYLNQRTQNLNKYFWKCLNTVKFIELVSTENLNALKKIVCLHIVKL